MEEIVKLLEENRLTELKEILIEENPIDIAEVFEDFPKEKYLIIFKLLPKDFSSEVFSYLSPEKQQEVIENITDEVSIKSENQLKVGKRNFFKVILDNN